jgi:hypothetical protein
MPGHLIAMPKPLNDGQVEYPKGPDGKSPVPETVEQYAKDVAAFMVWMAEPHLEARKRLGFQVMMFLIALRRPALLHQEEDLGAPARPRFGALSETRVGKGPGNGAFFICGLYLSRPHSIACAAVLRLSRISILIRQSSETEAWLKRFLASSAAPASTTCRA